MSWVKPRRTTTRSAARSVRFSGNVYAGTCQPRSRSASETSKTRVVVDVRLQREREDRQLVAAGEQLERPELVESRGESRVATSRAYCCTRR